MKAEVVQGPSHRWLSVLINLSKIEARRRPAIFVADQISRTSDTYDLLIVGETFRELGQSLYASQVKEDPFGTKSHSRRNADPQGQNHSFVQNLIDAGLLYAVREISDGGLAIAVSDLAMALNLGFDIRFTEIVDQSGLSLTGDEIVENVLFSEPVGRYLIAVKSGETFRSGLRHHYNLAPNSVVLNRAGRIGGDEVRLSFDGLRHNAWTETMSKSAFKGLV